MVQARELRMHHRQWVSAVYYSCYLAAMALIENNSHFRHLTNQMPQSKLIAASEKLDSLCPIISSPCDTIVGC